MYAKRIGIQDKSAESCEHGRAEGRDERERERERERVGPWNPAVLERDLISREISGNRRNGPESGALYWPVQGFWPFPFQQLVSSFGKRWTTLEPISSSLFSIRTFRSIHSLPNYFPSSRFLFSLLNSLFLVHRPLKY